MAHSILTVQVRIEAKKKQIANLRNRISDLEMEIDRVSKNTDMFLEERNKFLSSAKNENNILASVMYTTTIQQNLSTVSQKFCPWFWQFGFWNQCTYAALAKGSV